MAAHRPWLVLLLLLALVLPAVGPAGAQASPNDLDPSLRQALAGLAPGEQALGLVVHERGQTPAAIATLDRLGLAHSDLDRVGVSQVLLDRGVADALARAPAIASLWPEARLQLHLDESVGMVHARALHEAGVRGQGATVLVIDTGVDATHPDLVDRVRTVAQPHDPAETGLVPEGYTEGLPANDWFGHGTHVSGIVAGTGAALAEASPQSGRYVGVAPEAELVVWSIPGLGNTQTVFQALQGFEYALEHQASEGIQVITNSWGAAGAVAPDHPISVASREAYLAGMSVVFSTGNDGEPPEDGYATSRYASVPWALSVAAATKGGEVASFSSRGNSNGAPWDRPDVIAPGEAILAAKSRIGVMQALGPTYAPGGPGTGDPVAQATHYQYASGTSMSAPHVAGVLALMYGANPQLSPDQAYDILVRTADPFPGDLREKGIGMVNASAAVAQAQATSGQLDAFLAGGQAYADPADLDTDPVTAYLRATGGRDTAGQPLATNEDLGDQGGFQVPAPGPFTALLVGAVAALAVQRGKKR